MAKRIFSLCMAFAMCLLFLPGPVLAGDDSLTSIVTKESVPDVAQMKSEELPPVSEKIDFSAGSVQEKAELLSLGVVRGAPSLNWAYDSGTKRISVVGSGDIPDYDNYTQLPWSSNIFEVEEVFIGSGVRTLGRNCFVAANKLKRVILSEGVTTLKWGAFAGSILNEVYLPSSLASVQDRAFAYLFSGSASRPLTVYYAGNQTQWRNINFSGSNAFAGYQFDGIYINVPVPTPVNLSVPSSSATVEAGSRISATCYYTSANLEHAFGFNAYSSNTDIATVEIRSIYDGDYSSTLYLTVAGVSPGSATITVVAWPTMGEYLIETFPVRVTAATPRSYTVTFNANGGNVSTNDKTVTNGSTYGTLPTPTRAGHTFDGWYTAESGGTEITANSTVSLTNNQTLYAHWSEQVPAITEVSRNENTITANVVCADSNATIFCGVYDNSGKMISVRSAQVTGESNYQFQFDGQQFDYAKAFIVDSSFRPLCDGKRS